MKKELKRFTDELVEPIYKKVDMKTIDRTNPVTTSLELSRKITEALEGLGVRVETQLYWTKRFKPFSVENHSRFVLRERMIEVNGSPAYLTDDLMALLPDLTVLSKHDNYKKGYRYSAVRDVALNGNEIRRDDNPPEALGKLLVHLIEEGILVEESFE